MDDHDGGGVRHNRQTSACLFAAILFAVRCSEHAVHMSLRIRKHGRRELVLGYAALVSEGLPLWAVLQRHMTIGAGVTLSGLLHLTTRRGEGMLEEIRSPKQGSAAPGETSMHSRKDLRRCALGYEQEWRTHGAL